jgi:hypothetical protein
MKTSPVAIDFVYLQMLWYDATCGRTNVPESAGPKRILEIHLHVPPCVAMTCP